MTSGPRAPYLHLSLLWPGCFPGDRKYPARACHPSTSQTSQTTCLTGKFAPASRVGRCPAPYLEGPEESDMTPPPLTSLIQA